MFDYRIELLIVLAVEHPCLFKKRLSTFKLKLFRHSENMPLLVKCMEVIVGCSINFSPLVCKLINVQCRETSAASGLYGCFVFCSFLPHCPQPFCLAKSFCCKVSIGLHVADHSAPMFCPAASCASGTFSIGTIIRYIQEQSITLGI